MKKAFALFWMLSFGAISYIVLYEAAVEPDSMNHAVDLALIVFLAINFPVGFITIWNPWWIEFTEFGQSLGLPLAWSEGLHLLLLNGAAGGIWWFVVVPKIVKLFRK